MSNLKAKKVAVLYGGTSAEREVSLNSGEAVLKALLSEGYNAHPVDTKYFPVEKLKENGFEIAFVILHGRGGEDGTMQGVLEHLGIPYTGCGVLASALTMDKIKTKLLWQAIGLPTAKFRVISKTDLINLEPERIVKELGLPLMVKPSLEGSSVGLSKVKEIDQLIPACELALSYDEYILVEQWLAGDEYSVPVLGKEVLPSIRIKPANEIYDYEAKYISDDTEYFCPSGLSAAKEQELKLLIEKAYNGLGCKGWARIDVMTDSVGDFYLLEVNTTPGMTSHSLVPKGAKVAGYSFEKLVAKILELSVHEP